MATAEEILAQAAENGVGSTDTKSYLTVDLRSRVINVPSDIKILGVESDDEVNRLYFKIPRFYGEVDLADFIVRINYTNANGDGDLYHVEDVTEDSGMLIFSWLVGRFAFTKQGNVNFSICMLKTDDFGVIDQEFNTTICSMPVLKGLETVEMFVEEERDALQAIAKETANAALEGFEGVTNNDSYYDTIIHSREEWKAMIASPDWNGARNILLMTDLSWTEDDPTINIPSNVLCINGGGHEFQLFENSIIAEEGSNTSLRDINFSYFSSATIRNINGIYCCKFHIYRNVSSRLSNSILKCNNIIGCTFSRYSGPDGSGSLSVKECDVIILDANTKELFDKFVDVEHCTNIIYEKTKLSEFDNDEGFITDKEIPTKVSQLENDEDFVKSSNINDYISDATLPKIYTDERKSVISKVQENEADFRIVAFADPHSYDENKYKKYNDILNSGCIDALVGLGDYQIYSAKGTKKDTIIKLTEMLSHSGRTPNCFYVVGNHDVAIKDANSGIVNTDNILTKKELFDCVGRHLNGSACFNKNDPYGGYYYSDFEAQKIRLIVLNTSDIYEPDGSLKYKYTTSVMIHQTQIDWFVNYALNFSDKDTPSEWGVIVCQHAFFDSSEKMISSILAAAKSGTVINKTWSFKRTLDNPNSTEYTNLLPINLASDSYTKNGITITRENDEFILNGTSTSPVSIEIVPRDEVYAQLNVDTTYIYGFECISGTSTSRANLLMHLTTENDYELIQNTTDGFDTITLSEAKTLTRFAINVGQKDITFTNYRVKPILAAQDEFENGLDESDIITDISVNRDFSTQGKVSVICVLYGHEHENAYKVSDGIPFIQLISDNSELDDFYKTDMDGFVAGSYFITTLNGAKLGFTASDDHPSVKSVGYNEYFGKYGKYAPVYLYDENGDKIRHYMARVENYTPDMIEITGFVQERTPGTIKTESCSVVSIDKDTKKIAIIPYGTGISKVITF